MRVYLLLCFFITSILFSQEEKRLALVIGNSNYDSIADLKNPVNDAKLIAKTLDSLDFDVIEAYDLDFNSFYEKIEDFADKRKKYDVGFFYYAGHGVQIEGDNYLLPTSNSFDRKWKIKSGAIKVNDILEYLTSITDQVNILILDACRNNPLEEASRGSGDSDNDGLAVQKIPTGSIIGYSAESGKRAYDGKGENSFYSLSLSKNMLKENLSIDQVFRNVRTEVLGLSNKRQRPIEQSQLTGQAFYLNPSEYSDLFKKVDSILISDNEQDLYEGLTLIETVINKSTDQISIREALILKARLYSSLKEYKNSEDIFLNLIDQDSLYPETYIQLASLKNEQEQYKKAIELYTKAIEIEPENDNIYFQRTTPYEELEMYAEAVADYKKAIEIDPDAAYNYLYLGNLYKDEFNEPEKAIAQYLKMLDISPENTRALNNIGITYQDEIKNFEKAKEYYLKSIEIDSTYSNPYFNLGNLYSNLEEHQKAIEFYTKSIKIEPENSYFYYYRATPYESLEMYAEAEADYLKAIELDPEYEDYYLDLGDLYKNQFNNLQRAKKQYLLAIGTYNRRIKKEPKRASYYHQIGEIYSDYLLDFENGLKWTQEGNSLKKTARSLVTEATLYQNLNNFLKAEEKYLEAIELDPKRGNSLFAIANLYMLQKKYLIAEEYVKRSIKASINDPDGYYKLAIIFLKEKDYLNAYEQISFSINKELNNKEGFRILGFDNISILKLEDLYILRSEIAYKLLGKNNKSCEDLNKALELNNDNISIKEKINEICN